LLARTILAAAAGLALAATPARAAQVWTTHGTEKLRPSAPARATADVSISAARNEFEPFQIAITGAATNVRATATDLAGPGAPIPVRLYRAALITLSSPSSLDGGTGAWPDALVPAVDELAGEPRNAFPFSVPAGETRAVWAEVHVPADAPAGEYRGSVSLSWDGGGATVPVKLTVWPFTLPSTATLKSAFAFTYGAIPMEHGLSGDAFSALRARYGQLALDHRVTLSRVDDGNPDLPHLTAFYGAQVDGAAPTTLAGARMTSFEFVGRSAYGDWASWFSQRGWTDRLFQYTCDEPPLTCAWSDIPARARSARSASPPLRTLVTTSIQEADAHGVTDSIDVLVPVVNFMDDRPGSGYAGNQRWRYDSFLAGAPGRELWLYQSCMSHGCGGTVNMGSPSESDRYFTGWPSYMIDASAVRNRAMEWLSFRYRATGELYYETAMAYGHDPWTNQWDFSGNGDGTLFYPGQAWRIGGTTDVPVASIRLKMIREGMEDYEYLHLLAAAGDEAFAREVADALFPSAYATEVAPAALLAAREKLARRIVELGVQGGTDPAPSPVPAPGVVAGAPLGPSGCASGGAGGLLALLGLAALARVRRR
jgi:MYXO-CTERM domain-containing protein